MRRQKAFRIASGFALVAWVGTALAALLVVTFGIIGLAGWGDYTYRVEAPVPGLSLYLEFQPSWEAELYGDVCDQVNLRDPATGCYNVVFH